MLLQLTDAGLWCEAANVYIDPWRAVDRAIVTHAHSDHLRGGSQRYIMAEPGIPVAMHRLGQFADRVSGVPYGETWLINGVRFSLHPAGHILGSAQVRVEYRGEVWVVTGDYKLATDPTCAPWEPVPCHTFVTECTFGLPVYRWPDPTSVADQINAWWADNAASQCTTLLYGYSLGKAQRLLALLDPSIGPVIVHGSIDALNAGYRVAGVTLPQTHRFADMGKHDAWGRSLVLMPPSADAAIVERRSRQLSAGIASGWMQVRGMRRRRGVDRGFVLSDHVDWPSLLQAVSASGAQRILATHGYVDVLVRWLREQGLEADALATPFRGEVDSETEREADSGSLGDAKRNQTRDTTSDMTGV